jgi:hypothetical protein
MSYLHGKRKYAGPTVQELRKVDQDPARLPPHKKPRTYVLKVISRTVSEYEETHKYPSRAARDQAKAAIIKQDRENEKRRTWRQNWRGHRSKTERVFEESDIEQPLTAGGERPDADGGSQS